jgi:hypothetical protein
MAEQFHLKVLHAVLKDGLGTAVAGSGRDPAARRAESKTCRSL